MKAHETQKSKVYSKSGAVGTQQQLYSVVFEIYFPPHSQTPTLSNDLPTRLLDANCS